MILKTRWQRLAFVLSIVWILGAGFWERSRQVEFATNHAVSVGRLCLQANEKPVNECLEEQSRLHERSLAPHWSNVAFIAFVPVAGTWILVALVIAVFRWVRKGS